MTRKDAVTITPNPCLAALEAREADLQEAVGLLKDARCYLGNSVQSSVKGEEISAFLTRIEGEK